MNFFQHQAVARRNTRLLVILFGVAVILLLLLTGLLVAAFTGGFAEYQSTGPAVQSGNLFLQWDIILAAMGATLSAISLAVLFKWYMLKGGGKVVAESLGGRRLSPDSQNPLERKVLNVVEEMAIAANMPVPPVYLLEQETGINAFAAGYSPRDAVIGVTRGCVENLSRDQLQGVVAHEIAHILNGDMRMNIRIMAILNGILFISHAGYLLLRTGAFSRRNDKNPLPLLGIGLLVIGSIGVLFGNIIKAAVSREREYLADASAVQFTRNPDGIGGALEQIGALSGRGSEIKGSQIGSKNADEASHLFFGQAVSKAVSLFATHPPLAKRIKRIRPSWDGKFRANSPAELHIPETAADKPDNQQAKQQAVLGALGAATMGAAMGSTGGAIGGSAATSSAAAANASSDQFQAMRAEVRQTEGAEAYVFALALSDSLTIHEQQLAIIRQQHGDNLTSRTEADYQRIKNMPLEERLPLVELAVPALKHLAKKDAEAMLNTLDGLLAADQQTTLYEWCLLQMVQRYVRAEFAPNRRVPKVGMMKQSDAEFTLSVLAFMGHANDDEAISAFQAGAQAFGKHLKPFLARPHSFAQLAEALDRIDQWAVEEKEQLVRAWLACAQHDGSVNIVEQKMLTTLSACIGEPLPPSFSAP